ncbi:hypothetical protein TURU_128534 [Turdus rufiventris]|nr:hypothetical protein TURU_128534 [Turdus rufiventris]
MYRVGLSALSASLSTAPRCAEQPSLEPLALRTQEAMEMLLGLEQLCYGDRLEELGLFSLDKRKLQRDLEHVPEPKEATGELENSGRGHEVTA